jgi:hypothetical protein
MDKSFCKKEFEKVMHQTQYYDNEKHAYFYFYSMFKLHKFDDIEDQLKICKRRLGYIPQRVQEVVDAWKDWEDSNKEEIADKIERDTKANAKLETKDEIKLEQGKSKSALELNRSGDLNSEREVGKVFPLSKKSILQFLTVYFKPVSLILTLMVLLQSKDLRLKIKRNFGFYIFYTPSWVVAHVFTPILLLCPRSAGSFLPISDCTLRFLMEALIPSTNR